MRGRPVQFGAPTPPMGSRCRGRRRCPGLRSAASRPTQAPAGSRHCDCSSRCSAALGAALGAASATGHRSRAPAPLPKQTTGSRPNTPPPLPPLLATLLCKRALPPPRRHECPGHKRRLQCVPGPLPRATIAVGASLASARRGWRTTVLVLHTANLPLFLCSGLHHSPPPPRPPPLPPLPLRRWLPVPPPPPPAPGRAARTPPRASSRRHRHPWRRMSRRARRARPCPASRRQRLRCLQIPRKSPALGGPSQMKVCRCKKPMATRPGRTQRPQFAA
mmetsp:Transcript_163112/g.523061  ORF Transcript_163112/g.523061 Transcript_163112/m.523061 type:complete len:276 (-) Transcript_163112:1030-1857(-)